MKTSVSPQKHTHGLLFYPQTGWVAGRTDGVTGQFGSICVWTLVEDQLTWLILPNKQKQWVNFVSVHERWNKVLISPPGGATVLSPVLDLERSRTHARTHTQYHEVSQLQASLAAVKERVVLSDYRALWLAQLSGLLCKPRRVAHFGLDLHVGRHDATEPVQDRERTDGRKGVF